MLPLRILVRTNVDWRQMDEERFAAQTHFAAPLRWVQFVEPFGLFRLWDDVFPVSFFEYRARLAEIAAESIGRVQAPRVSRGLDSFADWFLCEEDEIIVPTDDDDFFRSDLGDITSLFVEGTDLVIWNHLRCGFLDGSTRRTTQCHGLKWLLTNNWAVRKSYLKSAFAPPEVSKMLARHRLAHDTIYEHLGLPAREKVFYPPTPLEHPRVRFVDQCYSMYNEHVGSIFFLKELLRTRDDVQAYLQALDWSVKTELVARASGFRQYLDAFDDIWTDDGAR